MSAMHITKNNFRQEILESDKPVLLDFWASWCGPCRMLGPVIDEIADERPDIKVAKINVDEEPELAAQYQVITIPAVFVLQNGRILGQSLGAKPKQQLLAMLP